MRIWAILPAAGIGRRFGSALPKQYLNLCGIPVILHAINRLLELQEIEKVIVSLHPDDQYWYGLNIETPKVETILGGDERADSVANALESLEGIAENTDWVAVHDAVRPCLTTSDLKKIISELKDENVGGILASPIVDTLKRTDENMKITKTLDRNQVWSALTPQVFRYDILKKALSVQRERSAVATDEAGAVEALGYQPRIIPGEPTNIKITEEKDLALAEHIILSQAEKSC
ncbi:MAG: 2-C-methyl-D-erythritol 4-phosphate cytidylyltransferase [Gammaproteobacteria bacterium]|nr:2-C-methyl-D-erythritol 4-phosphate cytidylyltransferase [Gammaproteobacteria bacterium]